MLVTDRGSVFPDKLPFRNVVQFLLPLVLSASASIIRAQTVTIKLVDGRNGRPVAQTCVDVIGGQWGGTNNR